MVDVPPPLPSLSPIAEKAIVARFDGGRLSSDGGLLVLRQIERRLSVANRLAACIDDPRDPASTSPSTHRRRRLYTIELHRHLSTLSEGVRDDQVRRYSKSGIWLELEDGA
jgi:hypothetical protein